MGKLGSFRSGWRRTNSVKIQISRVVVWQTATASTLDLRDDGGHRILKRMASRTEISQGRRLSATEPFRVHARLIAEIGDELISADEIAIYELVKNAFDAGSPWVRVDVSTPVAVAEVDAVISSLEDGWDVEVLTASALQPILRDAQVKSQARRAIRQRDEAALRETLLDALKRDSQIVVEDRGSGMNRSTLEEGFLSLATPLRLRQVGAGSGGRPVLGSKGLRRSREAAGTQAPSRDGPTRKRRAQRP